MSNITHIIEIDPGANTGFAAGCFFYSCHHISDNGDKFEGI